MTAPVINPDGVSIRGANFIYAPAGQAGEYAPLAANPYRGCGHGCVYCLSPETLIQKADGSARRLADIRIGDELIGINQRTEKRRAWNYNFAASRVLNRMATVKPAVRITLANHQSVVCSDDHQWLTNCGWKYTNGLTLKNEIRIFANLVETPRCTEEYRRGYLAGIIRGHGSLNRYDYSGRYKRAGRSHPQKTDILHQFRLVMNDAEAVARTALFLAGFDIATTQFAFEHEHGPSPSIRANSRASFEAIGALTETRGSAEWQRGWLAGIFDARGDTTTSFRIHDSDPHTLSLIERAMGRFNFQVKRDTANSKGTIGARIRGGIAEAVRFFNLTSPAVERKFPAMGATLRGSSKIVGIEPLGRSIKMLDITTSTENFIANGMISHNCYVPKVLHMDRREFDAGAALRPNFLDGVRKDAKRYQAAGITEQVMLSFTSDPYHRGDTAATRETLEILAAHGLAFCTLTKGGTRALRDLPLFRPSRDAFACTLTSLDDQFSAKWERNAALPSDRITALKAFHHAGIFTWVSLEPTLDTDLSLAIVRATHGFVDLFKVGRVNYLPMTCTTDWASYTLRMLDELSRVGTRFYIKRDLQPYLPEGISNPLRIPQHH